MAARLTAVALLLVQVQGAGAGAGAAMLFDQLTKEVAGSYR
jgi:hypothetical protein